MSSPDDSDVGGEEDGWLSIRHSLIQIARSSLDKEVVFGQRFGDDRLWQWGHSDCGSGIILVVGTEVILAGLGLFFLHLLWQ